MCVRECGGRNHPMVDPVETVFILVTREREGKGGMKEETLFQKKILSHFNLVSLLFWADSFKIHKFVKEKFSRLAEQLLLIARSDKVHWHASCPLITNWDATKHVNRVTVQTAHYI